MAICGLSLAVWSKDDNLPCLTLAAWSKNGNLWSVFSCLEQGRQPVDCLWLPGEGLPISLFLWLPVAKMAICGLHLAAWSRCDNLLGLFRCLCRDGYSWSVFDSVDQGRQSLACLLLHGVEMAVCLSVNGSMLERAVIAIGGLSSVFFWSPK